MGDEAFEEIAEAVGKVVEEDATLDTKDKKKAKFKELRTKLKSAIAEQKGVDASTIDDIDVRKAQKRAAKLKVKKKRIAQKRAAANSGGRRRLGQAEENAELKNDIARMEGKPVEDVKDSEVEEDKMGGEDEAFEEIAEAVGKVVEEDATLDTKDKKKAKFKEL